MKMSRVIANFKGCSSDLQCPICKSACSLTESGSVLCREGHCFDLSSKGYVNFIPGQSMKKMKYDKNLFENRKHIFLDGFYEKILEEIAVRIQKQMNGKEQATILDAGCGEGYYSLSLWKKEKLQNNIRFLAMDIAKDAISMACKEASEIKWMVANLNQIPLQDQSVDILLNILTVADYEEFIRVLQPDGILIKVVPGEYYLQEIRECAAKQLGHKTHSNEPVTEHLQKQMTMIERIDIKYQLPVTKEQAVCFLNMTPMTFGVDIDQLDYSEIHMITIHLEIILAKKKI